MTIDQQTSIQRSVAMKAATDIFVAEVSLGEHKVPLSKLEDFYRFIVDILQEEE